MARLVSIVAFLAAAGAAAEDPKPKDPPKPHREKALESKDAAKLFKAETWKEVQAAADKLLKEKSTDLLIDTIEVPPKITLEQARKMSLKEKEAFFHSLVTDRAKADKLQGVYIIICKQPTYLYVGSTGDAHFPSGEASKMRNTLIAGLKDKKDETLLKSLTMALEAKGLGEKK